MKPKPPPATKTPKVPPPKTNKPKPTRRPKPKPKPKTSSIQSKSSAPVVSSISSSSVPAQTTVQQPSSSIDTTPLASPVVITDISTEVAFVIETQIASPSSSPSPVIKEEPAKIEENTTVLAPEVVDSEKFKLNGRNFHVINKFEKSLASADKTCFQNKAEIASVTSQSLTALTEKLKEMTQSKVIIGTWNGDGYALSGENCLILQTGQGIYPGTCSEASAILCQSV